MSKGIKHNFCRLFNIKGRWLEKLGVTNNQMVTITIKDGKLIVELTK